MARDVKRARPASADRGGQARTRLARAAVVGAARTLFLERGYPATTVEAISALSEVPPATVYRLFTSKLGILKSLLDVSIAGDDTAIPLPERPDARALLAEPDPRRRMVGFVGINIAANTRAATIYPILVSAAGSDPHAAALLADYTRRRQRGQGQIARSLARTGSLRPNLRERDAADIIHALMSPEVYRLFVADRGWTPDRYQHWLTTTLIAQLLPQPGDPNAGPT